MRKKKKRGGGKELPNLKLYAYCLTLHSKANTTQELPRPPQTRPFRRNAPAPSDKLTRTRTRAGKESRAQEGAFAELREGCSRGSRPRRVASGQGDYSGLPSPARPPPSPGTRTKAHSSSLPPPRAPLAGTAGRRRRRHRSEELGMRLSVPARGPGRTTGRCARGSREPAFGWRGAPGAAGKRNSPAASPVSSETGM